jgi:hypothetical protein
MVLNARREFGMRFLRNLSFTVVLTGEMEYGGNRARSLLNGEFIDNSASGFYS